MSQTDLRHRKAKEISPNIYWINGGSSNLYLAVEEEGLTLFDCGVANRAVLVFEIMAQLGYQPHDLKQVVVTHADPDHVGSLASIQKQSGCKVFAGQETAKFLKQGVMPKHLPSLFQWLAEQFVSIEVVDMNAVNLVADGDNLPILGGLRVIATPGHTPDHLAYFSPVTGILFCGDAVHTRRGPIRPSSDFISHNPKQVILSARKLLNLSPAVFASGHGTPSTTHTSEDLMMLYGALHKKEAKL
ncbi:MAG: MBL fold metallo-hydrolase [Chloroflexota bacterium]